MSDITENKAGLTRFETVMLAENKYQAKRIKGLETELANEKARGIHSCHDNCTRDGCVNIRLRERVNELEADLKTTQGMLNIEQQANNEKWQREDDLAAQNVALREALACAEYALMHSSSDQKFAIDAAQEALAQTDIAIHRAQNK